MKYLIYPLKLYKKLFFNTLVDAQNDVYPNEPKVTPADLEPFEKNSVVIAAFDKGKVVGFSVFAICKSSRNSLLFGSSIYLYVYPAYRNTSVGGKLIKGTEDFCRTRNCDSFKWDINKDSPLVEAFNKRSQYKLESFIYSKSLV